ncbi:uncharacterized protein LOC113375804 [Ctenocephalides felis]|uniref:uncharacterized protein LOC113375804 n=1 Tax=Ctenocephalides felis TaxID=7515 RepID=UPI000E6E1709|nr:uncharacterized protein LOC113375804 [Ctenocephalides felis]
MSGVGLAFRWLDILEKEFDKNIVDINVSLGDIEAEEPELALSFKQRLGTLSSCWAQLSHKAQTIFQVSTKTEAELVNLREELSGCQAEKELLQDKLETIARDVREAKSLKDISDRLRINPLNNQQTFCESKQFAQARALSKILKKENDSLRNCIINLQSEVYEARLTSRYLDKELAGRIQQLQLLGREIKGALRDKLWRQLEAEILIQRHKTVVRACRNQNYLIMNNTPAHPVRSEPTAAEVQVKDPSEVREIVLEIREPDELGIFITGGREHGLPIIISDLNPSGVAFESGAFFIGDTILKVNDIDLLQSSNQEAINIISNVSGVVRFDVQYCSLDSDDALSLAEDDFHTKYFDYDGHKSQETPTAPRTPEPSSYAELNMALNNFVDNDNNIQNSVTNENKNISTVMYENSDNRNKVVKPDETHMYQSPMRESTDSSDNLLSILSSDEQSPKTMNYRMKNSCRSTNANDIFEPENVENFRKPDWLETLTVKDIDTKQHSDTIVNYAKPSKQFSTASDNKINMNDCTDPYYYYIDKENYYNNTYRNSSVNSSLSSTPVHKRHIRQRSSNSPEPNPGIRTIDQIFNKSLNVSKRHANLVDNIEVMSTDSSYSCQMDKTESSSHIAGYTANSAAGVEILELDCNERNMSDSNFSLKSGVVKTINSVIYDDNDYLASNTFNLNDADDVAAQTTTKADRECSQKYFNSKPRSIRIGYARRVPPVEDALHIPLKVPNYTKINVLGNIKDNNCQSVDVVQPDVIIQTSENITISNIKPQLLPPNQVSSNQKQHSYINGRGDPEIGTPV